MSTDKVVRDGKVAVVYSPGYGAGWSTWNSGKSFDSEALIFSPGIVRFVEAEDWEGLVAHMKEYFPDAYLGGMGELEIAWVPVGTRYILSEFDGNESVEREDQIEWRTA